MIRYLYAEQLDAFPRLRDTMFRHRAEQFHKRLGWEVSVDAEGFERDGYDDMNPLYVIWEMADGTHGGSMRFLPTTGDTMVSDHFLHLTDGVRIESPLIWECTRFCLSPDAPAKVSAALMAAGGELMRAFHLTHFVGVFDRRMIRIYRMIGSSPEVLGSAGEGSEKISVGLWQYDENVRRAILARAGISLEQSQQWFARSFDVVAPHEERLSLVA
ncbi:acyl-homoserine-lactone synthase [Roseitranquillus sediminis]|uniref:acyl-homoserine-lactone synthase n=1 Tax=Roseitranquillus sediminis TaxID=2809051 RepID=UPI001D0C9607|nr:acyl-homoserine-lactone synthase [Roseitranquillus sediminis]MBM9594687.1 autoinducer synthase [Roseitranquillus sediminis]